MSTEASLFLNARNFVGGWLRDVADSSGIGWVGRLAQLVERHVYTVDVGGSSPSPPTKFPRHDGMSDKTVYSGFR